MPEMSPNGEALPANTYLCYRGYDKRRKDFAPLLADGSLGRSLGRPPLDRSELCQRVFPSELKVGFVRQRESAVLGEKYEGSTHM